MNDIELVPGLNLRSNAYYRQGTLLANWGSLTTFGSTHWQVRGPDERVRAGQPKPEHIPFGPEITVRAPRPPSKTKGNSARHVTAFLAPGVSYTADLDDLSVFMNSPGGSLVVRAPQTPYPHWVPVNNWQVVNNNGQYMMGSTLTFAEPPATWPRAVPQPGAAPPSAVTTVAAPGSVKPPKNKVPPDQGGTPSEPVDPNDDINQAINNVATQTGLAISVGGLIGGVVGLGVGCAFVGTAAALGTASAADFGGTAPVTGCILGAVAFGTIGATIGGLAVGLPVLVASGISAYNDLHYNKKVVADNVPSRRKPAPAKVGPPPAPLHEVIANELHKIAGDWSGQIVKFGGAR